MSKKHSNRFNESEAVFDNLQMWKYDKMQISRKIIKLPLNTDLC